MNIRIGFLYLITSMILLASGCAKYEAKPLKRLVTLASNTKEPSITLVHKVLDQTECKKYLDRDVISQGYQPVQITLANNSDRHLEFSKDNISIPHAPADEVAPKVHTSTVGRAVGYGIAGIVFLPMLIPAVIDGVGSARANDQLDKDFAKKELEDQAVKPFSTINGLVFVPEEDFNHNFAVTLFDAKSHEKFILTAENNTISV